MTVPQNLAARNSRNVCRIHLLCLRSANGWSALPWVAPESLVWPLRLALVRGGQGLDRESYYGYSEAERR